ncbi:integrase arm-type DNA-binding domain-containing protein [Halomonas sp. ATCH28]|uniref:Integrase arm-type DNA-binding domain-containing protein n=1 Tax=Halomonas gemina TaxID=2945105 RepID=A0ABT0T1F3_9GAMM|nr:integrase arm-type DNA-binding domain-containing protein [Halomonas gemina]MCL7940698.1 integrase arm-type DNA-binding domain-containing protein [Halomonas gemina]
MPKKARELSAIEVKRLTAPGLFAVGGVAGLHLQVTKSGARSWVLRVKVGAKRRDIGLGGYPDVPLTDARAKARAKREQIAAGIDPVEERRAARLSLLAQTQRLTFDEATEKFLALKRHEFRNPKHAAQWESTLATYAAPVIGRKRVDEITLAHIEDMLTRDALWTNKTETAKRLRGRVEKVLDWATAGGHRTGDNPARWRGNLDARLPNPGKVATKGHHAALPIDDMPRFKRHLAAMEGSGARCLEFAILTATRSREAKGARWAEIDLDAKLWTIPAERMKARKEHRVPLSRAAVGLLKALPRHEGTDLVFPSARGKLLSENTLTAVIKRMDGAIPEGQGYRDPNTAGIVTTHGFRSTFRDWAGERTAYPGDICEMALAHTIKNKAEAAYRRGDLLEKRRHLMQDWAKFCAEGTAQGNATPIRRASDA